MKFGICELSYVPLRAGMSHRSEMVNQLLFGEVFEIEINRGDWTKIRLLHDDYEGWIESTTISDIEEIDLQSYINNGVSAEKELILSKNEKELITIPIGSKITHNSEKFKINNNVYSIKSEQLKLESTDKREQLICYAQNLLNTPYLWGGRTAWGIDCSGFTQLLYRLVGINISRDAGMQVSLGNTLNFLTEAQPGDLAFFDNEEGVITHVGLMLNNSSIIHASKYVRTDIIDHQGIYNKEIKKYTHNLRVLKSII